jgi:hypothetical protein
VPAVAALAQRSEQVAQRPVTEEVERLVGDFELGRLRRVGTAAAAALAPLTLRLEVGRRRDIAFFRHPIDDLLDQFFQLRSCVRLIAIRRIAEQPFDGFFGQHAAVEQRIQNRVVQRLHRLLGIVHRVRVAEPAREQQIGKLRDQIFKIEIVELVTDEFRVPVSHDPWSLLPTAYALVPTP